MSKNIFNTQASTQTIIGGTITSGVTPRLAYYTGTNEIDDTDIAYTANEGLTRSDGLKYIKTVGENLAVGTLYENALSERSITMGKNALLNNPTKSERCIVIGNRAGQNSTGTLYHSVLIGTDALIGIGANVNSVLFNSTIIGSRALQNGTNINDVIAIGVNSYESLQTGTSNINIGANMVGLTSESNTTRIGTPTIHNRTFISGIRGVTPDLADGLPVVVSSTGQLTSSIAPVVTGTTSKLAFYSGTNQVSASGIDYTATNNKLSIGANTLMSSDLTSKNTITIGTNLDLATLPITNINNVIIGKDAALLANLPALAGTSVAVGAEALRNTSINRQVAVGYQALSGIFGNAIATGGNTAVGYRAGAGLITNAGGNTLIGSGVGSSLVALSYSIVIGSEGQCTTVNGTGMVLLGCRAAAVGGNNNMYLGSSPPALENNVIRIGSNDQVKCFISSIRGITPDLANGQVVEVSSVGQLTSSSSYVKGPINSIDNRIATYSGVTGKLLSNLSAITADGAANMSGVNVLTAKVLDMVGGGAIYLANTLSSIVGTIRNQSGWLFHTGVGGFDTYLGYNTGNFTGIGLNNTVVGATSLQNFTSGANNIVVGVSSGGGLTTHTDNIIVGNNVTGLVGSNNISIGNITGVAEINTLRIGNTQTSCFIPPINSASPTGDTRIVYIDSVTGQLTAKTGLYKPMAEVFYGDGGATTASFTMVTQNQWYGIDSSNFTTGAWTLETNNAKFLAAKWDDNGVPGQVRYISSTMDMSHTALSVCMSAANAGHTIQMCILDGNTPIPSTIVFYDFVNNNVFASMAYHKILTMTLNKVYKLGIRCISNANSAVTLYNLNFVLLNMETLI